MFSSGAKPGRPKIVRDEPHLPFNYLKIYEGYKGPHYNGALVLEFEAPGALFAPTDMKLIEHWEDLSGETIILESTKKVLWRDKSLVEFVMLLRQNKRRGFVVKDLYKKGDSLGYINASNLYLEVAKGEYCGHDHHLFFTTRADNLFSVENMKVVNDGQPLRGGEPIQWDGILEQDETIKDLQFHKEDYVASEPGHITDTTEMFGERVYYLDSIDSWMGEDYIRINDDDTAVLLPSIVADIKEECGVVKLLINGYWIDQERLHHANNPSQHLRHH